MLFEGDLLPYVKHLWMLLQCTSDPTFESEIQVALQNGPSLCVTKNLPTSKRRSLGAFFTPSEMAGRLLTRLKLPPKGLIVDPMCGAGDLLLQVASKLGTRSYLKETLQAWGSRLCGTDIVASFVDMTICRLALLAKTMGAKGTIPSFAKLRSFFPYLFVGDANRQNALFTNASVVLLNPPYGLEQAPVGIKWARGTITAAANYVMNVLNNIPDGCKIALILPEVLRSGTRYELWRKDIAATVKSVELDSQGQFSTDVDVDVFFVTGTKGNDHGSIEWSSKARKGTTIEDLFHVHVGPVVPHRHRLIGPLRRYLHARVIEPWEVISSYKDFRKFNGTTFKPPFVVVKRTSRPSDHYRAVGGLVLGNKPVAIENHLLVCLPKNGKQETCRLLLRSLQNRRVSDWLNKEIRCRHLTIKALSSCVLEAA